MPTQLSDEQRQLLVTYLRLPRSITRTEWVQALTAFDVLHAGRIVLDGERVTFQAFYLRYIDTVYTTPFMERLLVTVDVEADGVQLMDEYWWQIVASLTKQGVMGDTVEVRALVAYCLYWWRSFTKGYIREVTVFRDLTQAGIAFEAHDVRDPVQRRSSHDLTVHGRSGDVKTSTYFLHTARTFPLRCDFYIVRLWDDTTNRSITDA